MASKEKMRDAKELYDLKQRATNYYKDNGIPAKMEAILNAMFYDNPDDVYGHLVCRVMFIIHTLKFKKVAK